MFLEINNIIVLVNYIRRTEDILIRRKKVVLRLTVLKKICKTKDFLGKKKAIISAFPLCTRPFPPAEYFCCRQSCVPSRHRGLFIDVTSRQSVAGQRVGVDLVLQLQNPSHGILTDIPCAFKNYKDSIKKEVFLKLQKKILKQRCCPKQILFKGILKRYILLYQRTYMYLPEHSIPL